jgi:hypothetical protein
MPEETELALSQIAGSQTEERDRLFLPLIFAGNKAGEAARTISSM